MTELWVIENAPKAGRGHGRNDLNFAIARFGFDVTLMTACGANWSTCVPRGGEPAARASWRSSAVSSRRDTVDGFEQGLFVCLFLFFFVSRFHVSKEKRSNLKHDVSRWSRPAKLERRNVLVEPEATMLTCRYEGSANVPNWRMAV